MPEPPDLLAPRRRPSRLYPRKEPPGDPREKRCHCGEWAWWGGKGDEWRCTKHRDEIGFDHEGKWRNA